MAPPLDRRDLYDPKWKSRPSWWSSFPRRLPRRTRRATYACWLIIVLIFYLFVKSLTSWPVPASFFEEKKIDIIFPRLYHSLSRAGWSRKATVFAAGNLEAASKLVGVACEMSTYGRTTVHFALMGFDTLPLEEFRELNGVTDDAEDCFVHFHDARVEFADILPQDRKEVAVKSAFRHVWDFVHPLTVIVYPALEEEWFLKIAREKVKQLSPTLIELPEKHMNELRWITRLDSGSLTAWHQPTYEVIVYADTHSGNLVRLLKSLKSAYYPGPEHYPTHVTIVLDPSVPLDPFTRSFLNTFTFPDKARVSHRRSLRSVSTDEDAAVRFVEAFYPRSADSSVLILNANTQLSKWYYHYLLYATLEYRYSLYRRDDADQLFGISLEDPPSYLSGDSSFSTPEPASPFLYPAPNPRAALYFPQHWAEFHDFYSHQLRGIGAGGNTSFAYKPTALPLAKDVETSWQKPYLELIRTRGYTMLYPGFAREALAVVHNEVPSHTHKSEKKVPHEKPLMERIGPLEHLPDENLPTWNNLPLYDLWGKRADWDVVDTAAMNYRLSISTCPQTTTAPPFSVADLFCDADGLYVP